MPYTGSCHCGAVTFRVAADTPTEAIVCNCSHCACKGLVLTFVPADRFTLEKGADNLTDYLFHKHAITHQFCKSCGAQPFALGTSPQGAMRAINLRCVPDVAIDTLSLQKVDGASL